MSETDHDRLAVALAAKRPISDAPRVPLEVERLLSESQRRVSVADHQAFRESLATRPAFDDIDHAMAVDYPPERRSERETSRVLGILDELQRDRRSA